MKLSRKQTRVILAFRRALLTIDWWPKMKWKDYISCYYYYKCYKYERGGGVVLLTACYDNWLDRVSIKISERNPYKSRYKELFGAPSF